MMRRSVFTLAIAAISASGCAALATWDGFAGVQREEDAGKTSDVEKEEPADVTAPSDTSSGAIPDAGPTGIVVVQTTSRGIETKATTFDVDLQGPEHAGNTIVVVVGWYDTLVDVTSVTDTRGNTYVKAVGPTRIVGDREAISQSIFFAASIKAPMPGLNKVTTTFTGGGADGPDVRIAEVAGLKAVPPFVVASAKADKTMTIVSDPVNVAAPPALLVGASTTSAEFSTCAPGFDRPCVISPQTNMAGFRVVDAGGAQTMTPPAFNRNEDWILQLAVFR